MKGTFAFVCLLAVAEATFSTNFRSFLTSTFGAEVEKNLSRTDLGEGGLIWRRRTHGGCSHWVSVHVTTVLIVAKVKLMTKKTERRAQIGAG